MQPIHLPAYKTGGIPTSTSQCGAQSSASNTGGQQKCPCLQGCFISVSTIHLRLLVNCTLCFLKGQKDTTSAYIHQAPYDAVFFCVCKVSKTEPVLFVHISPLLNYISLAHGLKFCKAFLKILLMVAILCQKVHLACKFKHGLQIFKSWAYCSNKHFQQGGEKLQGIHFQHNSSSGTSPPLAPNKTTTRKEHG